MTSSFLSRLAALAAAAALLSPSAAQAQHVYVNVQGGMIQAVADPALPQFSIDPGTRQLLVNGQPFTILLNRVAASSGFGNEFVGWYERGTGLPANTSINLATNHFYGVDTNNDSVFDSGPLGTGFQHLTTLNGQPVDLYTYSNPGDFNFELLSLTPISGSPTAVFAYVNQTASTKPPDADADLNGVPDPLLPGQVYGYGVTAGTMHGRTDGATQAERSVDEGLESLSHFHGNGIYLSDLGTYQLHVQIWDSSGQFASAAGFSDFFVQVQAVPEPATWALLGVAGIAGAVIYRRRRKAQPSSS